MCTCCHRCGYRCLSHGGQYGDRKGCDPGCHLRDDLVVVHPATRTSQENP